MGGVANDGKQGERFLMEDSRGILIRRSEEGGRTTATAMQMVQERFNKETRNTDDTVFVQTEANSDVRKPVTNEVARAELRATVLHCPVKLFGAIVDVER